MNRKKQIYYARTYRRLQIRLSAALMFVGFVIMTSVFLFVFNIHHLTDLLTGIATRILSEVIPTGMIQICTADASVFGQITYISLPAADVDQKVIGINLIVCVVGMVLMRLFRKSGTPVAVFALFAVLTHLVSCVFFWFAGSHFPYTLGQYSELYVKQQIGIWLIFFVLSGLVITLIGEGDYPYKFLMLASIMSYSFVFGTVRYILFLYLLHIGSLLYMAILFFVFGPMFDFSYLVAFYAVFMNKKIKEYEYGKKRSAWKWS